MRPKWITTMIFRCEIVVFGGFASGHADLRMDGRTDEWTDVRTDEWTHPLIERRLQSRRLLFTWLTAYKERKRRPFILSSWLSLEGSKQRKKKLWVGEREMWKFGRWWILYQAFSDFRKHKCVTNGVKWRQNGVLESQNGAKVRQSAS